MQSLHKRSILAAAVAALFSAPLAEARVTGITILSTTDAFVDPATGVARSFGAVGSYQQVRGTYTGELEPGSRHNLVIADIENAPRTNGKVTYTATFTMLKPKNMDNASGVLVYGVPNRGGRALGYGNRGGSATNAGDGFDQNPGHVYLASGWQGDLPFNNGATATETIRVPVLTGVTGPTFARFVGVSGTAPRNLPGAGRTPAAPLDTNGKLYTIARESNTGVRTNVQEVPRNQWAFSSNCSVEPPPPSETQICVKGAGFNANLIYELVYTAKDPLVLGVGMAAMRDINSFFRYGSAAQGNFVAGEIQWAIGYGISQSGRFQKNFLLLGFNEDEDGRIVWDGANPIIAGQMGQFNIRFAQPGNIANIFEPGAEGPIWWNNYNDKVRGRGVTGILERCRKTDTCPKIFDDFGGPEIWYSRGSVGIAGTTGKDNLALPGNVRRYYQASTAHGGGPGGFAVAQPPLANQVLARNPNPQFEIRRALFTALVDWVTKGTEPPKSQYPRVNDGTLVPSNAAALGWPAIPGAPTPDNVMNVLMDYDLGPDFRYNDQSGVITNVVPPIKQVIPTPAARLDADGNEVAGVKSVLLQAPLGTYTSWNQVASGPLAGNEPSLAAGYIPFKMTRAERLEGGDPRLSIEERYGSQEGYNCLVQRIAQQEVQKRFLLQVDADRFVAEAAASPILPSNPNNATAKRLCAE